MAFPARRKAIFVHGCFWHSHACKTGLVPHTNRSFWLPKLRRNKLRDKKNVEALTKLGWDVLIIWQCELKNYEAVRSSVTRFLGRKGRTTE
jgi:DNA mismatch endonuclease, patch repair protein